MKEWIAFLLPPATAFAGMRINRLLFGHKLEERFGFGCRFALGLAVGMLVFSQSVLLTAIVGINAAGLLAWAALVWGIAEACLMSPKLPACLKQIRFQPAHLWLLLLLPVLYSWWVFGRLSTLEGTLEFDANAFWVFKAKILYLEQGKNLLEVLRQPSLAYMHMDYPMLVPCLYALDYGLVGGVNEFVNKVWPFWMMVALSLAVLSLANIWKRPHPLPMLTVVLLCFLPASLQFIRQEGGTIPLAFHVGMTALLLVVALSFADDIALAAGMLTLAGCATTKFEGIIYAAVWSCVMLMFCWRHDWLKKRILWKAALLAAICLLPYFIFRLAKPVPHPEFGLPQVLAAMASPGYELHRFLQSLFLYISARFFSPEFFHWQSLDKEHLQFNGEWTGLNSLLNPELSLLPWLLLVLLGFALWRKSRSRLAVVVLVGATFIEFAILSLIVTCLPRIHIDANEIIGMSGNGRHFYPFFVGCFLGITAVWFVDKDNPPHPSPATSPKSTDAVSNTTASAPRSKKRR